jgi:hypothetical protein
MGHPRKVQRHFLVVLFPRDFSIVLHSFFLKKRKNSMFRIKSFQKCLIISYILHQSPLVFMWTVHPGWVKSQH